jgi:chromosome segregation ATPase
VESLRTDVEKYLRLFQSDELRISELMIKISDLEDNVKLKRTECERLEKEKIASVEKSFEFQKMFERLTNDKLTLQKDLSEAKIEHQKMISELRLSNDALKKEKKAFVKKIEKLEKEKGDAFAERDRLRLELTEARSHQQKDKVSVEVYPLKSLK